MGQRLSEEPDDKEIDVAELQEWYKKFVVECPSGTLFMHEFKSFFGVTNNQEAADYIENMFRAFDKNGDNTIDFLEYVAALNLVLRGKLEHKLKWTFKMYDKDGSGCIDKTELKEIVEMDYPFDLYDCMSIYRMKKACHGELDEECNLLSPDQVVDRIFELVDENGDGELSLDEFVDGARRDKWVMKMLQMDMSEEPKSPPETKEAREAVVPRKDESHSVSWSVMSHSPGQSAGEGSKLMCVKGDLFSCPATDSLAHCISEDCRMAAGIAVHFRKKFGGVKELLAQQKKTGECAVLKKSDRFVYYLITKKRYNHKPTYETLRQSLEAMKAHCIASGVTRLSMPRFVGLLAEDQAWLLITERG
ncbi:hypothetical protein P4O66_004579 [Electrophorus voltai]|uniref:Guanylyl cyclase-activating protein 2 n=1 Tax=Electrophorus voltai TaxID=2609070 RepID=A0AAD8ZLY2_9TELE|nr:hypothetical protein P4O66_004579 [Electrophorus voltai]